MIFFKKKFEFFFISCFMYVCTSLKIKKMLIETEKIVTEKLISPNKLPFLQSQVLQKIYLNINN